MSIEKYTEIYNNHNAVKFEKIEDGFYLSNHIYHDSESRARKIQIIKGSVLIEGSFFSQSDFFTVNRIIKKI